MYFRFIRDSFCGRLAYHFSGHRLCRHKEDLPDYIVPKKYLKNTDTSHEEAVVSESLCSLNSSLSGPTDLIIVSWDGEEDPDNPQNWPVNEKVFFILLIALLTASVYIGSAIYTPGIEQIMQEWDISQTTATVPLTIFVVGYGIGPMLLSPITENSRFGRTSIYIVTLFVFVVLHVPIALARDITSLCILRFISGFFACPALATGGASVGDIVTLPYMPIGIAAWCLSAFCGPSLGPLFGSVLSQLVGWRSTFWFMLILCGSTLVVLAVLLPETYGPTLLSRKARRLRELTGNCNIVSQGELDNMKLSPRQITVETLWRPVEIILFEPIVLFINLYIALVYSVMYLWFEAFPIVFLQVYHFSLIGMGVAYMGNIIGVLIGCAVYIPLIHQRFSKRLLAREAVDPEVFLPIAIFGSVYMPVGIFIFGWTATAAVHWAVPILGTVIFATGAFIIFQTLFNYLSLSFWRYLASVFAGNTLFRSVIAAVFPLLGKPLFQNFATPTYPVAWGCSVLGFISVAMVAIPVVFYLNGPKLRAKSKYSGSSDGP